MWPGYCLLQKPAAITMAEWRTVLVALYRVLERHSDAPQPSGRLHYRVSLDGTAVLVQADFDTGDLTINGIAAYIKATLGSAYTLTQIRNALANHITVFGDGKSRALSASETRAYLAANAAVWESEV
jgi:hypothetical protein